VQKEWIKGPINKLYQFIVNHFHEVNEETKIKILPHLSEYVILPDGFNLLSKLVFANQIKLIKECCKLQNVVYVRDSNGNTPLLYALKRECYESIDELLLYISQRPKLINNISLAALCLLMKLAP